MNKWKEHSKNSEEPRSNYSAPSPDGYYIESQEHFKT